MPFPILMYHALWPAVDDPAAREALWQADPQMRNPGARRYALDIRQFTTQLDLLCQRGRTTPKSWKELEQRLQGPQHGSEVLITFDDGHRSNIELARPQLRERGLSAVFFITTDWIDTPGFMTADQLRAMHRDGFLLGTHGCSHRYFHDLTPAELQRELIDSRSKLEAILGEQVTAVALPGGSSHPRIRAFAQEAGYHFLFTSRVGLASAADNLLDLPRIAITNAQPATFFEAIASGNEAPIRAMARSACVRGLARRLLGHRVYDLLRARFIKD